MAKNRMYMRCKVCGRGIMLAKNFVGAWWMYKNASDIDNFFTEHEICTFRHRDLENFELCYENSMTDEEERILFSERKDDD